LPAVGKDVFHFPGIYFLIVVVDAGDGIGLIGIVVKLSYTRKIICLDGFVHG